jgi:hypothetical protein
VKRAPEQLLVVRYEDLVDDVESTMGKLATFLGLDWHEALLKPTYLGGPWYPNTSFVDLQGQSGLITSATHHWAQRLLQKERLWLEWRLRRSMSEVGYADALEPEQPEPLASLLFLEYRMRRFIRSVPRARRAVARLRRYVGRAASALGSLSDGMV